MKKAHLILLFVTFALGLASAISVYWGPQGHARVPAQYADKPGPRLFFQHDCASCHTVSSLEGASGTLGPGLDKVAERAIEVSPQDGGRSYLRESILEPRKVVKDGFADAMPSFAGKLSEAELSQLIDWLLALDKDASKV